MARLLSAIAGLSFISIAISSPLAHQLHVRQNASSPCAQVSASVATQTIATPTVAAQLAYECITSVPFNQSAALALVDGVVPYLRWQSNTVWLKDPPAEYAEKVQPAVDIWGELETIRRKVVGGEYKNEFEFGMEFYFLFQGTHDGHFIYTTDVVGTVFNWARPVPLVSVSADGKELPKPYVYADVLAESLGNTSFAPSPITKINGEDAIDFLENWSQYGTLQDRDALYNNVFYELATVSLGPVGSGIGTFAGSGRGRWIYPGPTTELEFANGTSRTYENFAKVLIPFKDISDGESLYKLWFTGNPPTSSAPAASTTPIPAPGYPPPVVRESHNYIGGYYLEDEYSDVAVLSVPSFASTGQQAFQKTAEDFLAAAKAAGKKKLIVDVQANGGGTILLGYDLYKLLFPNEVEHAAADRIRATEAVDLIGQKFSDIAANVPRVLTTEAENATLWDLTTSIVSSPLNYRTDTDADLKNFTSWDDKFGPVLQKGDNFTNVFRWNLSDPLITLNSGNVSIHGHGPLSNYTEQPFAAEDVVVVTEGYCSSTCSIFSELMRQRAGVKHISLGGRARPGLTQHVGGTKGTNNYPWAYLQYLAKYVVRDLSSPADGARLNKTELGDFWPSVPFDRAAKGTALNVNFRDGIRDPDLPGANGVPLQFVYEASDCRILYTKPMTVDVTAIWKTVADTAWRHAPPHTTTNCIAGGLSRAYPASTADLTKRDLTPDEAALSKRVSRWRAGLSVADYPLDLRTDLSKARIMGDGVVWP